MQGKTHIEIGLITYANFVNLTDYKFNIINIPAVIIFSILPDIDKENSKLSKNILKFTNFIISIMLITLYFSLIFYFIILKNIDYIYILPISIPIFTYFLVKKHTIFKKISIFLFFIITYFLFLIYTPYKNFIHIFVIFAFFPFFKHRTFTHSISAIFLIGFTLFPMFESINFREMYLVSMISYISHIILGDIFTKRGVPLLYPFSKKYFKIHSINCKFIDNNIDNIFLSIYIFISSLIFFLKLN